MGIEARIDIREIRAYLEREVRKHEKRLVAMLQYVGQTVVNEIRTSHISNWDDQTGNLRSSTGYIVSVDGIPQVESAFEMVDGPDRAKTTVNGSQIGKNYAESLVPLFPRGIALIVVAGMSYASYVEKLKNKTVLAQGELEARKLVDKMIQELNAKLNSK